MAWKKTSGKKGRKRTLGRRERIKKKRLKVMTIYSVVAVETSSKEQIYGILLEFFLSN